MSRGSVIGAALGLPPNAQDSPDPAVRRAYWAAAKRHLRARKFARKLRGVAYCPRTYGPGRCGGRLEFATDRLGRTLVLCPKCERRKAGICARCPRPVAGQVGRAMYCADCRYPVKKAQRDRREHLDRERFNAQRAKAARRRRKAVRVALADPRTPPDVRDALERKQAHERALNRAAGQRFRDRQKARRAVSG